jgi:hypothetical protein
LSSYSNALRIKLDQQLAVGVSTNGGVELPTAMLAIRYVKEGKEK